MSQQCRECGAKLPDGARSCMQCGTTVELPANSAGVSPAFLEFMQPAVSGGLMLGVLSSLPFISILLIVWVLAGGALTANILMKRRPQGISYGDGAFGGALSGLVGSIVATLLLIPDKLIFAAKWVEVRQQAEQLFDRFPVPPGPMRDLVLRAVSPEVSFPTEIYWFFEYGIIFSLFAMMGGMLMVWLAGRQRRKLKRARP